MGIIQIIFIATGSIVTIFFGLFCITSIIEKKIRAAIISGFLAAIFGFGGTIIFISYNQSFLTLFIPSALIIILAALFFLPIGRKPFDLGKINDRYDERSIMFAREEYHQGSEKYKAYYEMHPELKDIDDKIRSYPELLEAGGRYYHPWRSGLAESLFEIIEKMGYDVDGTVGDHRQPLEPAEATQIIKDITLRLGADEVGIARLNPMYVYSHVGRGPEPWGASIENNHKYAVAFTLEMNYERVEKAPRLDITEESVWQYFRAALISISLASAIRKIGYPARAHISGSNYQIIMPPVAYEAGLGELGRFGYLISRRFGARIRLGAVTTDLPLVPDKPISFGVQEFCETCKKCAVNCPSAAIPDGDRSTVRGINKWPLNVERCITYWRLIGTDCGLCMKVCPFSHPPYLVHDIIRAGIKHSRLSRYISAYADDLFYGKKTREFLKEKKEQQSQF